MIALSVALIVMIPASVGQAATILEMYSHFSKNEARSQFHLDWANEIKKRTNGEVEIKFRWADETPPMKGVQLFKAGEFQLAAIIPLFIANEIPFHMLVNSIPMGISEVSQASELMERLLLEIPEFDKEGERIGMKALFFHFENPLKLVCKEQITGIADMKGKVTGISRGNFIHRSLSAVGANYDLSFPRDWNKALSEGQLDCVAFPIDAAFNRFRIFDVAKHVHDITLGTSISAVVWISSEIWKELTNEQRYIFQETSFVAGRLDLDKLMSVNELAIEELKARGVQFHDFPPEDAEKWREASPDFLGEFIENMTRQGRGDDAREVVKIWKEVITH